MGFAKQLFGKSLRELTYSDIESYFQSERKENDTLEFKSYPSRGNSQDKLKGIFKSVCAFLNSSGGIIVWGAPEGTVVGTDKEKTFKRPLTSLDPSIEKDMLVSSISSNLIPLAGSFNLELISDVNGNNICVIEVFKSNYAPHQYEGFYYMRLDGISRPAPHHYIEALFKRISYPNLEGYLKFGEIKTDIIAGEGFVNKSFYFIDISILIFNYSEVQNEENIFFRLDSDIGIVHDFYMRSLTNPVYYNGGKTVLKYNATGLLTFGLPYLFTESFRIDPHEVGQHGWKVKFDLKFGGKQSPLKISSYTLNISNYLAQADTNKLIVQISENDFVYERAENEGITKHQELKTILGR
jgi:hypothetical protein